MNYFNEPVDKHEPIVETDNETQTPETMPTGTSEGQISEQEIIELISRFRRHVSEAETDDEGCKSSENDEIVWSAGFDDEDDEDDYDDDDEDDDEDEIDTVIGDSSVGKCVILRHDFKSNTAYCNAVVHSIQTLLRKQDIPADPKEIRNGVKVFAFDRTTRGVDIDCHILVEYEICNFRIEFTVNVDNQPGRTPLIDYFCQDKSFPLRYGKITMDHDDGEKKIEYSSCFYGAFSEEAFNRYWDALYYTVKAYAEDYENIAGGKKLTPEQRRTAKKMMNDLACNLPTKVKEENENVFNLICEMFGNNLSPKKRRLLNFLIEMKN